MSKKIALTIAIIAVLTFLFVIGVSAENIGGIEYTLYPATKTATFAASNRTDCTLTRVVIPETVVGADGETYTVTAIADRSIGHQDANAGNNYIEYLYIPKTVTSIGAQLVRNCYSLKEVKIDAKATKLSEGAFWGCSSLQILDLSGMTELTTLESITSAGSNTSLQTVKFPSSLKTIYGKAFQSSGLTSLVLPNGIESIGDNCFQSNGNSKVTTLVLPATLNSVGGAAFHGMYTVQTLVFANTSFDGWSTNVTFNSVNPNIIFFAGSDPTTLTNHYTQWATYKTMKYADYINNPSAVEAKTIVYGTENCTCGYIRNNDEPTLQFKSYTEAMELGKTCAHCGSTTVIKTIGALFTCLGYSAPENGNGEIAIGYTVNNEAIDEYTSITGKALTYGVFVASQNKLGENDIFDQEGNKTNGVVSVEITNYEFTVFELKVVGFTDENKGSLLAMGAYVKATDSENAEYSYIQDDTNGEKLGNYYFVSYDSIVSSLS